MAKMKVGYPEHVLNEHQVGLVQKSLGRGLLRATKKNFPNWRRKQNIAGGEIILQKPDATEPIVGLTPGIHLTVSLVSFKPERDYYGLAEDLVTLIKHTKDAGGSLFMTRINVYVQLTLDMAVKKAEDGRHYRASSDGKILLEFKSVEDPQKPNGWYFAED